MEWRIIGHGTPLGPIARGAVADPLGEEGSGRELYRDPLRRRRSARAR